MEDATTEKFKIRNIDCVNCAVKIEAGLKQLDGVAYASLDFANQMLHVKMKDSSRLMAYVHSIEPDAELVPYIPRTAADASDFEITGFPVGRELFNLVTAVLLFAGLLFFETWLQSRFNFAVVLAIVMVAYLLVGWNVIAAAFRTIKRGALFDENVLMVIATGGAIAIAAYAEAIGVMLFYKVGEMLQARAVARSRRSIHALLAASPDRALLLTEMGLREVAPEAVEVGATIVVRPGEKIPLDGEVMQGRSQIDTSALTGEAVPVSVAPGDGVLAGQICMTGTLTLQVTRPFGQSSIAKVMALVEDATARKAKTERFITTFARYYTPAVVVLSAAIAVIPPLVAGASFETWIYRALVILVISCPCALVVSIPLGYFGGIGRASRRGILVKGANFLDALAKVKTVVFDKTGTLTRGEFKVREVAPLNGFSRSQLLEFAAAAECHSNHPIALSILTAYRSVGGRIEALEVSDHNESPGKGVVARYRGRSVLVGNDTFLHYHDIAHLRCEFADTTAHVAVDGIYAGYIIIGDEVKPDAADAVRELKESGIEHVAMLTGDNQCVAQAVATQLKLDSYHAGLFPEEKVAWLERLHRSLGTDGKIAFVGDGINDAPVIARADVGVAMGGMGSDAAVEAADVVLMTDSPLKMAEAVAIARLTRRIVWQNIVFAFAIKGIFLAFGAIGMATMWEAVFADMGTALLAVANSARIVGRRERL